MRTGGSALRRVSAIFAALLSLTAASYAASSPALAVTQRSSRVAIIVGEGGGSTPRLQTTGTVEGSPSDSFESFSFSELAQEEITPATLAQFDTVVLDQVFTSSLGEAQKAALSSFVTSGGKLIIHDADGTEGNDYTWLPVPARTGNTCQNCGHTDGVATVVANDTLVSSDPTSPYFIDVSELPGNSDAVGDANVLLTEDPRWQEDMRAENEQNSEGAVDAYAQDGGLILYNGFDDDGLEVFFPSGNQWLEKIWYDQLNQSWNPAELPQGNPVVGPGGHCGFRSIRVGVASVCAEQLNANGSETIATGNVVLDGGVAVGNGPVTINRETKQISMSTPAPISLLRNTGAVPLGSAAFAIDATGTTDPVSGTPGVAQVSLTGASLGPLGSLRVGSLPFSVPLSGNLTAYLSGQQGGGLIVAGSIQLPMLGKVEASGALSLGFFAGTPAPVVALGGSANLGAISLGKGWGFSGLNLSYQGASDTWTASGGFEVPIGSLQASGSVVSGKLDSFHVAISGQDIPLGDSGFFFTGFGGGASGLARGPLSVDASTEGFWGAPKLPFEPFYLDNVTVTVNFGGSIALDGAVSLALKNNSPLHGQLHLKLGLHPFSATGSASVEGSLPGVSLKARGGAGFTAKHFTAAEGGSLKVFGLSGTGEVIASDKGLGASGTLCGPFHSFCQTMALAGTWQQIGKLDVPAIIGGEPRKLITVPGVAAVGRVGSVRVPSGRALLLITVQNPAGGAPAVSLRTPSGRTLHSSRSTRSAVFTLQPQFNLTTIAVPRPRAGRWTVSAGAGVAGQLQIAAQTVGSLQLVRTAPVAPGSSPRHPLGRNARIELRWHSSWLPRGARVAIVRRSKPHEAGVGIVGGLPASGHYSLPVSKLAPGRNYLVLAATFNGVPFQQARFAGIAWRPAPPAHKHTRKRKR